MQASLIILPETQIVLPVADLFFMASDRTEEDLNSQYRGAIHLARDGQMRTIERVTVLGWHGGDWIQKLGSILSGTHGIKVSFSGGTKNWDEVREHLIKSLAKDAGFPEPFLPQPGDISQVIDKVRATGRPQDIFGVLKLPAYEDCLDVM